MNVSELCVTPSEATTNSSHPLEHISEHNNVSRKSDQDITSTTNATNNSNTIPNDHDHSNNTSTPRFTLPPLSQTHSILQRLPSLGDISSYEEVYEEEATMVTSEVNKGSDTEEIKRLIEKCTTLCSDLARYKTWRKGSERDHEAIFDFVTHTAHEILDSLVSMQQQQEAATSNEAEYEMIRQARNWKENRKPKYRRRSKRSMIGQQCHSCHTSETPEWRRGPDGARTLCNACGLHYSKLLRKESVTVASYKFLASGSSTSDTNQVDQQQQKQSQPQHIQDQHHYFHNQQQHQHQQNQNYHHQQPLQHSNLSVSIPMMSSSDNSPRRHNYSKHPGNL